MREIKFRAWDEERKFMIQGAMQDQNCITFDGEPFMHSAIHRGYIKPGKLVLMQYTGLRDKNGKEIYEGDIVSNDAGAPKMPVEWSQDAWTLNGMVNLVSNKMVDHTKFLEVIGNIYENPELLTTPQ